MVGLFVILELFTDLVLETLLYAGAAGVSPVGLVAVAFWTWLWGPPGLVMATPLTVLSGRALVCIADLPPSSPSKARYLVKRLRAAVPGANTIVGRWVPPSLADGHTESILGAGAAYVSTSLLETREQLYQFVPLLTRQPMPAQPEVRVPDAA